MAAAAYEQHAAGEGAGARKAAPVGGAAARPMERRRRSNSTSSIYAESAVFSPELHELVLSVSTMLHCQIIRDHDSGRSRSKGFQFFNEETYTGRPAAALPEAEDLRAFLQHVFEVGEFPAECAVILLVYVNRLIGLVNLPLTANNWKPVVMTALTVAQKVWDDNPLCNADFSILYPVLNVKQVNFLELRFLLLLEYKLTVSSSLYARYYFELRTIYDHEWKSATNSPLTASQAAVMRSRDKQEGGPAVRRLHRSKTDDEAPPRQRPYILN